MWPGCPDFCLDGSPGAVSATFALDSVDYTDRIDPISRFIVWGFGGVSLDLYFTPAIDVDAGLAPELRLASLNLFSDPADPTLLVDGELPHDLRFLPSVNDRYLVFSNACVDESCEEVHVNAHTLSVVAEPSSGALLVVGLLAGAAVRRYRPRAPASLSSAARPRRGSSGGPVRPRPTSALG